MATVVSLIADDFDRLATAAVRQAPLADLVELRLDRIGHPGEERLARLITECGKPVIVTVHGAEAFGDFAGSIDERCELLAAAARAGARFVDIDWTLSLELGEVEAPCHRIVSRHDVSGTPADLESFDEEVRAVLYEGDAVKLVTHADRTEDGLRMLAHLRAAPGGLVAFCSGAAGSFTRLLAPIFGSPFTYAAPAELPGLEGLGPTAPGQLRLGELLAAMPPGGLTPQTAILGVVGRPIGHSVSPFVQGMALKAAHLDAVYVAYEPEDFDAFLDLLRDPNFRGLSVTAPFKEAAFARAGECDADARRLGAVNTLVRDGASWRGSNSDLFGVRETVERAWRLYAERRGAPAGPQGAPALVLGAGGAARAAVGALIDLGFEVTVAARRLEQAEALVRDLGGRAVVWEEIPTVSYELLLQTTPVGQEGGAGEGALPIPVDWIRPGALVLEAVYRPMVTPLLREAERRGCLCVPGGEWFVRQAARQFELFTTAQPDVDLVRSAFEGALGLA